MATFFGTDGIRGVVNEFLTYDLAYKCGNALGSMKYKPRIIIGGDTRVSRSYLVSAFTGGAMSAGASVIDIGICATAGVSYLTQALNYDYGVVISASHNPANFNGIKIFDSRGIKLDEPMEKLIESKFATAKIVEGSDLGSYSQEFNLVRKYEDYLVSCCDISLRGLKVLLDGSKGAAYKIAPNVFRRLGAQVISTNCRNIGQEINYKCGAMCPDIMASAVKKYGADIGVAFDGDSDRIIACDEKGNILDGDIVLYLLAKDYMKKGRLNNNTIVGTRHTNMGLEQALSNYGIKMLRTDIGDKYVIAKMQEKNLNLGGEKSGHIIQSDYLPTGDGILAGIKLCQLLQDSGTKLSSLAQVRLYPQCNIDCRVVDKVKIINSEELSSVISQEEKTLSSNSRIMVRVSGTEPKIRIMVESESLEKAKLVGDRLERVVYKIDRGI